MTAALTLPAKQRGGPRTAGQLVYCLVTDAAFGTRSCHRFATGYWLRRDGRQWFWDRYIPDVAQRAEIAAAPLRVTVADLARLPPALVIVGEAGVLRDEGGAYAAKLRAAWVLVTSVRYRGIIDDFVMLNGLRGTEAASAAAGQGGESVPTTLWESPIGGQYR